MKKKVGVIAILIAIMGMLSSCGTKLMSIDEAVMAIGKLKAGESITIVLNKDTTEITEKLKTALADFSYLDKTSKDFDESSDWQAYVIQNSKKVKLDLSKTQISEIEESAFSKCVSLASVTIPNGTTKINTDAFRDCITLSSMTIPDSITSIGQNAFLRCISLTKITIPSSVTSITNNPFRGCDKLIISVANDNKKFSANDGALYNEDKTTLIAWPSANGDITIPNSVTTIGDSALSGCTALTNVTIPDSVTTIGETAFSGCKSLTSIKIPDSVENFSTFSFDSSIMVDWHGNKDTWGNTVMPVRSRSVWSIF